MGSQISQKMDQQAAKMEAKQKELLLKQRQTQLAMTFAGGKEMFHWFAAFYGTIFPLCLLGAAKRKVHKRRIRHRFR